MALNITLAMPWYIILASDRRMISVPDGKPQDDEANKGIVLETGKLGLDELAPRIR